ncbi:hypothetical protein SLNWT_3511 [Streptomyces albus]|uniref:Uncharacterized protein n=1 Tax=Streptomyces albus (strain ATCC 21838 / DSM 41398 / FERM P-419 / JCM 4703 / NBRC 107858) TaxID=1081613 RepID=A0A0B5F0Q7_STRA4|nr:hypothetical protein SLNWT_3511 [Streptomyces albus]AOU78191.1 hypothetical protein SLNHY_3500 [Streptomyces albus]AYN33945.1 hypothetical protein DUI70_3444 [Streptomyces albus]
MRTRGPVLSESPPIQEEAAVGAVEERSGVLTQDEFEDLSRHAESE